MHICTLGAAKINWLGEIIIKPEALTTWSNSKGPHNWADMSLSHHSIAWPTVSYHRKPLKKHWDQWSPDKKNHHYSFGSYGMFSNHSFNANMQTLKKNDLQTQGQNFQSSENYHQHLWNIWMIFQEMLLLQGPMWDAFLKFIHPAQKLTTVGVILVHCIVQNCIVLYDKMVWIVQYCSVRCVEWPPRDKGPFMPQVVAD